MEPNQISKPMQVWTPRPLPKLAELHFDKEKAFADDELLRLLHQPANISWMKRHPLINVKVDGKMEKLLYMPKDKVQFLLTRIFGFWKREIKSVQPFFNSALAVVRIHVQNPLTGEWMWHDGVGAAPMQTDAGSSAMEIGAMKNDAVMKGGGSAVSYALKNACECWGDIFGGNAQNKEAIQFTGTYQTLADNLRREADKGNGIAAAALSSLTLDLPEIKTDF